MQWRPFATRRGTSECHERRRTDDSYKVCGELGWCSWYSDRTAGSAVRVSSPGRVKLYSFLRNVQTGSGTHLASCSLGTGFLPDTKQPKREVNFVPPSSADVRIRGATPLFPLLHGVDKEKFAF